MFELIAFDLDGTLTEHRTPIDNKNYKLLETIKMRYRTVIVGAGTCERIVKQLRNFKTDVIGNYGLQTAILKDNKYVYKKDFVKVDQVEITKRIKEIRNKTGYTKFKGDSVEFHESGAITFPLLGTSAEIEDKVIFDPQRVKRREIYSLVKEYFSEYTVMIGGSSSFDIVPKEYDKYKALVKYAKERDIDTDKILYVGDDFSEGGNDEPIYKSEIQCIEIDNYQLVGEKLKFLFKGDKQE